MEKIAIARKSKTSIFLFLDGKTPIDFEYY
jgi:hypothetical protein